MTTLDDKLRDLAYSIRDGDHNGDIDMADAITQIKQAFADEGSRKLQLHIKTRLMTHKGYDEINKTWTPQVLVPRNKLHISLDAYDKSFVSVEVELKNEGADLMTGQEWYDRFEKAASAGDVIDQHVPGYEFYQEYFKVAAKRAAGLQDA